MKGAIMKVEQIMVAYSAYCAQGEGVTVHIAIGASKNYATGHFKENVPEYYHSGLKVRCWGETEDEFDKIKELVPRAIIDRMESNSPGTTEWFSVTHYNLS